MQRVKLTCQTPGETINGDSLWDKTTDKCYVADWFVETGTGNMVVGSCGGGSGINGRITRKEVIARGRYWVNKHVPYSMERTYPDPEGTRDRTDCSGFVSMALHTTPAGFSTVTLPSVVKGIAWKDLKPGDLVGTLGPGTGGAGGHVTMFFSWVDPKTKKEYHSLECQGGNGCVNDRHKIGWKDGSFTSAAYRYIHIAD